MRTRATSISFGALLALLVSAGAAVGQEHHADINQEGSQHLATIEQLVPFGLDLTGGMDARITQAGRVRNVATIEQNGNAEQTGHITQIGEANRATQIQTALGIGEVRAEINQVGSRNRAVQVQNWFDALGGFTTGMVATIEQRGSLNEARQDQQGADRIFRSSIVQGGRENLAIVRQSATSVPGGFFSDIVQIGEGHTARVVQETR